MWKRILFELEKHAPFTIFGAITGIVIMLFSQNLSPGIAYNLFYVLHPLHVVVSALVTTSIYKLYNHNHKSKFYLLSLFIIGYVGSVGIATLSDCLIPYLGEYLLGMPNKGLHIGFIEKWWLINPLAILGILIAYFKPFTKFPHAMHVLLSTWASLFHIMMAKGAGLSMISYFIILFFLFLAVWLPCCLSDIIFPLIFTKEAKKNE